MKIFLILMAGVVLLFVGQNYLSTTVRENEPAELSKPEEELRLPDIVVAPPKEVFVEYEGEKKTIRFDTSFANIGQIDLHVEAETDEEKGIIVANQRVLTMSDTERWEKVGEFVYHPDHVHWHLNNFAVYELRDTNGELKASREKVGFCLFDYAEYNLSLAGAAEEKQNQGCSRSVQGISIGWMDTYLKDREGQSLDISGLADGRYRLVMKANPEKTIKESNYNNNILEVEIEIEGDRARMVENDSLERVTKKQFGQWVTTENSPVQPERFNGYHTGIDFEYEDVEDAVEVFAVADGEIVFNDWVRGYGGVAILRTRLGNTDVLALYGHLDPASITKVKKVRQGEYIGQLGEGNTTETDFARKHLHFGLTRNLLDLRGYVENKEELKKWLNPFDFPGLLSRIF